MAKRFRSRDASLNEIFKQYIFRAKRDHRTWKISLKNFLSIANSNCHYCKRPPYQTFRGNAYMGIDRIDNIKGYLLSNVVPCCKQCNSIKGEYLSRWEMEILAPLLLSLRSAVRTK